MRPVSSSHQQSSSAEATAHVQYQLLHVTLWCVEAGGGDGDGDSTAAISQQRRSLSRSTSPTSAALTREKAGEQRLTREFAGEPPLIDNKSSGFPTSTHDPSEAAQLFSAADLASDFRNGSLHELASMDGRG